MRIIQEIPLYGALGILREKAIKSRNSYFYLPFELAIKPNISYNNNLVSQDFKRFPKSQGTKVLIHSVSMTKREKIIMLKEKALGQEYLGYPGPTTY